MTDVECATCMQHIQGRVLTAMGKSFHPEHFICAGCKQPIVEERFQANDGDAFCQDCYAKLFLSTCKACKQPIKTKVIKALGENWHEEHFVCTICKKPLSGTPFFEKNNNPYCAEDYHANFSARCKGCGKPITDRAIIALNEKWHQDCFVCIKCKRPVTDDTFQVENGYPLCSQCAR